jgi:hypothetical protein
MNNEFDRVLDLCLDRFNRGESIEALLKEYPQYAAELEPLLRAVGETKAANRFQPSPEKMRVSRQRFYAAMDKRRRPSFWSRAFSRTLVWSSLAGVLVIVLISIFTVKALAPSGPDVPSGINENIPVIMASAPTAEGNFAFLVSDDVNAIADFSSVIVTIEKVNLYKDGESAARVEFIPEVKEFDLALLPGENFQELWRGDVPEGDYNNVVIYVTRVNGTLKATGETIEIKLPSNKLQLSQSFKVVSDQVTSFTYDMTVFQTGNAKNGGKYILKPQAGESGARQTPAPNKGKNNKKSSYHPDTFFACSVINDRELTKLQEQENENEHQQTGCTHCRNYYL